MRTVSCATCQTNYTQDQNGKYNECANGYINDVTFDEIFVCIVESNSSDGIKPEEESAKDIDCGNGTVFVELEHL
ncbi:hypothetical protein TRFO_11607 [Tritrichomonas foetus]|uniref:Uncharacterized protein n=1 Tax=Tritrichomonas foetus TaxID=1144522 RepID=A0A1J4J2F0_9EUKA|nr:hypothetical protein TRFO_11607 [Tritrichomonas foetus]|eukprot:OHS93624.1 hypothetical protein TRFO_11607 [Tritrichomonas foetus]